MNERLPLYESIKPVWLADFSVNIGGKRQFKKSQNADNRSAKLCFDAWIDDVNNQEKEVFLYISFSFYGSRRRKSFWIRDVFSRRIKLYPNTDSYLPKKEEYDFQATLEMLPKAFDVINKQLDSFELTSHKDRFERQMTHILSYDLERAFNLWHEDEKNGFLGVKEMSPDEAIEYLPTVFAYATFPKLTKEDYLEMLKDTKRVFLCEVSPDGFAEDVFRRMRYAIESIGYDNNDVFYYVEVGEKSEGFFAPDGAAIMDEMDRHFHVIKHIWGANPNGETRYTKAFVGLLAHGKR